MNIHYTAGAANDHEFLKHLILEKGDIAIFDKAYVDYSQYAKWSNEGISFVTREKDNGKSVVLLERDLPDDKDFEILLDEEIIKQCKDSDNQPQKMVLRRIVVWSAKHQDTIVLLTNIFYLEAAEISMLYQKRWRIELLFKQLKHKLDLKGELTFLPKNNFPIKPVPASHIFNVFCSCRTLMLSTGIKSYFVLFLGLSFLPKTEMLTYLFGFSLTSFNSNSN